jgi:hypothetical protein
MGMCSLVRSPASTVAQLVKNVHAKASLTYLKLEEIEAAVDEIKREHDRESE